MNPAIVAITDRGAELARRLGTALPGATVHLPERLRREDGSGSFDSPVSEFLSRLFDQGRPLVCIMATGIVVRTLAPHLRGKDRDPAVVVLDEAGRFAISLLSGHLGGGNDLAREVARRIGGEAVITTATDVNGLPAWDDAARRAGLQVEPLSKVRHLNTLLLRGEPIALVDRRGRIAPFFEGVPGVRRFPHFTSALQSGAAGVVFVTHRRVPDLEPRTNLLLLRPRDLVVGIGCNRGTSAGEIEAAILEELRQAFLAPGSVGRLATIAEKRDEEGIVDVARSWGLPVDYHPAGALNAVEVPSPPSRHALEAVGARGVCEPAAVLSSAGGPLLVRKRKRGNVTVAVAEIVRSEA